MSYLNLDLDYESHPKTVRLVGLLGRGSEIIPIRLWSYCGKFHYEDGRLTDYSEQEIEALAKWWGKPGLMLKAMHKTRFMDKDEVGWFMCNWKEHQGHILAMKLKGKAMAEARWGRLIHAGSNAGSIPSSNAPTSPTVPSLHQQIKSVEALIGDNKAQLLKLHPPNRDLYPKEYEQVMGKRTPILNELSELEKQLKALHRKAAGQ